jgi:hypothetical protein
LLVGMVLPAGSRSGPGDEAACGLLSIAFRVNGVEAPLLTAGSGDRVDVTFEVPPGCAYGLTLASFVAPAPGFDGSRLDDQELFARSEGTFGPGRHVLSVPVFDFAPLAPGTCRAARAEAEAARDALRQTVRQAMDASVTYREHVRQEVRRKSSEDRRPHPAGPYAGPCDESDPDPSSAGGKPCDGCVGHVGSRVPNGQEVPGTDANAGYRCDRNAGVGQGNPAHPGCPNFQLDFAYSAAAGPGGRPRLIAGLFCVRPVAECYVTDRTGSDAVVGSERPGRRATSPTARR